MTEKSPEAFRTISEVADDLDLPQHVLRFWETRFGQIRPLKRGGGRRYYRPEDVDLLRGIRHLLYDEGYTIKGVQRILKERGVRQVAAGWRQTGEETEAEAEAQAPEIIEQDVQSEAEPAADLVATADVPSEVAQESDELVPDAERSLRSALSELTECKRILEDARRKS